MLASSGGGIFLTDTMEERYILPYMGHPPHPWYTSVLLHTHLGTEKLTAHPSSGP